MGTRVRDDINIKTRSMMMIKLIVVLSVVILFVRAAFHIQHRANCEKKKECNGNYMCADVCARGSVKVDDWIVKSLNYQKSLQMNDKLVYFEMPSTHNSAITEAEGYGIEKYFISALSDGKNMDVGDDLGEGVCQYLSLTDQLRMGIRHIEIDIWWGPEDQELQVCHTLTPNTDVVKDVNSLTASKGIDDFTWDPKKISCLGTRRPISEVFTEILNWLNAKENSQELIVLYYDTKSYLTKKQIEATNELMKKMFGSLIYRADEGNPLLVHSPKDLIEKGKRVIFENLRDCCWNEVEEQIVFTPPLWTHQFKAANMTEFPDCVIDGDHAWYGKQWVRALDGSFTEAATRCGVQVVSGDYTNPDDLQMNVWSFDHGEPSLSSGCVAQLPSTRWATLDCSMELPFACLKNGSEDMTEWIVDLNTLASFENAKCPEGYSFAAPHNGYANNVLSVKGFGQTIWLNAPNPLSS